MGQQFLSAPPASGGPTPPPPSGGPTPPPPPANSRSAWPPPPPPNGQQPPSDPNLSDTMERMLRPQGLFQRPQPKQYDWNSQWTPGAATASTGPTPVTGAAPPAGPPTGPPPGGTGSWPGQQPPPGGPTTAPNPGLAPGGGAPQWGQAPTPPPGAPYAGPGGQYPPGTPYQTGALAAAGGPTPPPPGYPAGGPPTTIDRFGPGQGQFGPGGQFSGGQPGQGTYAGQPALPQNGQGQLPPGQYGQTTYAQGQYGAPQFGQGQLAPGQYGVDQYGATQVAQPYQDGQYGPGGGPAGPYGGPGGQYGQPGPYGPGGQFGPDGSPVADQKRPLTFGKITLPRSPLMLAIAGAALVAIVATVAILSLSSSHSSPSAGPTSSAGAGATPTATSSAAAGQSPTEKAAAASLAALLKQSGSDHAAVTDAVLNVEGCGKNLGQSAQTFSTSAANRETLLARLADLPGRASLPAAMINDLSSAWEASASVDTDLAKWANHAATAGCHGGDLNYSSYKASISDDTPATDGKEKFVAAWNPLAKQDGLPTYQASQL
jgi:hypothetical protein